MQLDIGPDSAFAVFCAALVFLGAAIIVQRHRPLLDRRIVTYTIAAVMIAAIGTAGIMAWVLITYLGETFGLVSASG